MVVFKTKFELFQLIKNEDESDQLSAGAKQVLESCSQIVDCLVDRLLTIEEKVVGKFCHQNHFALIDSIAEFF